MRFGVLGLLLVVSECLFAQRSMGDGYFLEGKMLLEKKQTEKSLKAFERARSEYLKEKNWYRYFVTTQTISMYYQDTGRGEESERILKQALDDIPLNAPDGMQLHAKLYDNLGYTYLNVMNNPGRAAAAYSESITRYEQSGKASASDLAFESVNRATAFYSEEKFEEASKDFLTAISLYESDTGIEKKTLSDAYYSAGSTFLALKKFEESAFYLNKALAIITVENNKEMVADIHNNLSIALEEEARYQEALDHALMAKGIYEQVFGRDADHYGMSGINTGKVYASRGDYRSALQQYQEVLDIYGINPPSDIQDLLSLMVSVGSTTTKLGLRDQANVIYDETLKLIREQLGDHNLMLADVYAKIAAVAFDDGGYDRSLEYNFKALDVLQTNNLNDPVLLALIYNNIGQAYDMLMELELALQYKNQALELFKTLHGNDHPDVALAIANIGLTYEMFKDYDKALVFLFNALEMRIKILGANDREVGTNYLNIGVMQLKKGNTDEAIASLEKAELIYEPFLKNEIKATVYNTLGTAWFIKRNLTKSSIYFQKSITSNALNFDNQKVTTFPENPEYLDYYQLITSYIGKADVLRERGDLASLQGGLMHLDAADKILKEKSILINNPRDRLALAQLNFFLTESGMQLVDQLVRISGDAKYADKAFYFSERNKANELYTAIRMSKAAAVAKIPSKILSRQREIAAMIQSNDQQLASASIAKDLSLISKLKSRQFALANDRKEIEQGIIIGNSSYAAATGQGVLPEWQAVKSILAPKTALVSYTITDSAKYVLIGTNDRLTLVSLDRYADIEKLVRGYRNQLKLKEEAEPTLSKVIWDPVEKVVGPLGIEDIIIIPDGPLSLIPFEALVSNGKYLLERYNIRYSMSCALMLQPANGPAPKHPALIALAPVFADEETNFVNRSCDRFVSAAQRADSTSRSFSLSGEYITPLPATEVEVQTIHKAVAANDAFSKYFLKKDANEEIIKRGELSKYDYIHFATHGIVNNEYPELSGLLLAQNKQSSEDGILYTGEIFGLDLKAQLVTLSACETALGKRIEGEGVRGLASAFLLAGARTVVVSLWKVADESTSRLMIDFYNQLINGKDKSTALREAKLSLLHQPGYAHPFYWAPFVQIGPN